MRFGKAVGDRRLRLADCGAHAFECSAETQFAKVLEQMVERAELECGHRMLGYRHRAPPLCPSGES